MELLGYIGAVIIGLVLGLLGGGGSILTIPVLVYLLGINSITATSYSLLIVGVSALFATIRNWDKNLIDFKIAGWFALPSLITIFSTRKFIIPALPETILEISNFSISKDLGILLLFAIVMIVASFKMILGCKKCEEKLAIKSLSLFVIIPPSIGIGLITGLVGAGGGFLIIPALVFFARLEMKRAIATSLFVISINSLVGLLGDYGHVSFDWYFLVLFTTLSIIGIIIGIALSKEMNNSKLKKLFGWFVLISGIFIIFSELKAIL